MSDAQHGRILSHHGKELNVEYVDDQRQPQIKSCHFRANLESVVTGDQVLWCDEGDKGVVVSIEPRETLLQRPDSYGKLRPVAANISQLVIVIAPEPEAHHGLIDRYLVAAENMGIKCLLVLNKADLLQQTDYSALLNLIASYRKIGYEVLTVSAHSGDGFEELQSALNKEVSIFCGQSGVGKSSLIKKLLPDEELKIGALSEAATKGRHTTTHTQLFHFPSGGECIDSPGIREFGLWHMDADDILHGFVDLREHALNCKFRNCQHENEVQCGIKGAVSEGLLYKWRVDSYKRIIQSLNDVKMKNQDKKR